MFTLFSMEGRCFLSCDIYARQVVKFEVVDLKLWFDIHNDAMLLSSLMLLFSESVLRGYIIYILQVYANGVSGVGGLLQHVSITKPCFLMAFYNCLWWILCRIVKAWFFSANKEATKLHWFSNKNFSRLGEKVWLFD